MRGLWQGIAHEGSTPGKGEMAGLPQSFVVHGEVMSGVETKKANGIELNTTVTSGDPTRCENRDKAWCTGVHPLQG